MAKKDDGGAAFPTPDCTNWDGPSRTPGMTLRDWFAGQALAGYLAAHADPAACIPAPPDAAAHAYRFADAMLAAREA